MLVLKTNLKIMDQPFYSSIGVVDKLFKQEAIQEEKEKVNRLEGKIKAEPLYFINILYTIDCSVEIIISSLKS